MSDGKWHGAGANRTWFRPGSRHYAEQLGDAERRALYEEMAGERFWCEVCGGFHPLREHRDCRKPG